MIDSFIAGKENCRGTIYVAQIEGEFAHAGLDDNSEFSDLQHALAMYQGSESDVRSLRDKAMWASRKLADQ